MPYAQDFIGIYKIVNTTTMECYVGQSQRMKKRVKEHFRLLKANKHTNPHFQNAYNKYGESAFMSDFEVICEDATDLDMIEEAFITGKAVFAEPCVYNIASFAKAPMRGKQHSEETRKKISENIRKNAAHMERIRSKEHAMLTEAARDKARWANPKWVADIKFIVENNHMTYAERGRHVGKDTGSTRKLYLRYQHLKGAL